MMRARKREKERRSRKRGEREMRNNQKRVKNGRPGMKKDGPHTRLGARSLGRGTSRAIIGAPLLSDLSQSSPTSLAELRPPPLHTSIPSHAPQTHTHTLTHIYTHTTHTLTHTHTYTTLTHLPHILTHTHSHAYTTLTQHTHVYHTHTYTHIHHTDTHAHIHTAHTFIRGRIYTLTAPVAKSLPKWFSSCLWLSPWVPTMVSEMESIVPDKKSVPVATLTL